MIRLPEHLPPIAAGLGAGLGPDSAGWILAGLFLVLAGLLGWQLRRTRRQQLRLESQLAEREHEAAALQASAASARRALDLETVLDSALYETLQVMAESLPPGVPPGLFLKDALHETLAVMQVEAGGLYLLDEPSRTLMLAASEGLTPQLIADLDRQPLGEGFAGQVARSGKPLLIPDIAAEARLSRALMLPTSCRSLAAVPLSARGKRLGILFALSPAGREFTEADRQLLSLAAQHVSSTTENARLFVIERRRAEQFRVLAEIGRRLTLTLELDEVLHQVARLIQQAFGYYHVGIGLIEADDVVYRVGAGPLWDDPDFAFKPARLKVGSQGLSGWVAGSGQPLLVSDVSQEPRYVWMQGSATRSELIVPIIAKQRVIGVLDIQSDRLNNFDDTDLAVMQSLAHQTGAAVENARLHEQAKQVAVMEERQRLARELHDAVTQTLFSASLIAEALPSAWERDHAEGLALLSELRQLSRGALAEMRSLLLELRPGALAEVSLAELLRQLAEAIRAREGLPVTLSVAGEWRLPLEAHIAFYRVAQEALNNVVKHARASQVEIHLRCCPDPPAADSDPCTACVELVVRDDGRGFDPRTAPSDSLGLNIMQERAQAIGAALSVSSQPGQGTLVRLAWAGRERGSS